MPQAKTNQQNKNKQTLNNKANNFLRAQKLLRGWKSFIYVWVLFLHLKSFRKTKINRLETVLRTSFTILLEFTVKDIFSFAKEIVKQNSSLVMGSLDVDSSLTNIFPDETIDICTNTIYSEQDVIEGINKEEFQISFFYH